MQILLGRIRNYPQITLHWQDLASELYNTNRSSGDSVGSYINVLWMQLDDMTSRVNAVLYSWLQGGVSGTSGEKETL